MSRDDWDRICSVYGLYLYRNRELYNEITSRIMASVSGMKVLDAACGNGTVTASYAGCASEVIACDYSSKMITAAQKNMNPDGIVYEIADACSLPYEDRSFDTVVICNALDQIVQPELALKEAGRVLKDDGILIVPTYVGGDHKRSGFYRESLLFKRQIVYMEWTPEAFLDFLEQNGWKITEHQVISSSVPFMYCECRKVQAAVHTDESVVNTSAEELYLPLKARIFTSRQYPHILFDRAAVNIEDRLPEIARNMPDVSEFSLLSHAVLSANAEKIIRRYMRINPDLITVNAGAGLETFSLRCSEGNSIFYELDEPQNLKIRETYFPANWYDRYLPYHLLDERWISDVKKEGRHPLLINAAGVFADMQKEDVIRFLTIVSGYGEAYVMFDADTSENGGILVQRANLRERTMPSFTIDHIEAFVKNLPFECEVMETLNFYDDLDTKGMKTDTRFRISVIRKMRLRRMYVLRIRSFS